MIPPRILGCAAIVLIVAGVAVRGLSLANHAGWTLEPQAPIDGVMSRLHRDLAGATLLQSSSEDESRGYLLYREGPLSDVTSGQGLESIASPIDLTPNSSGDTDDALVMTTRTVDGSPFTGNVPWGLLEAARAQTLGRDYKLPVGYDPTLPRAITGPLAEVVYWVESVDAGAVAAAGKQSAALLLRLHRRTLLIRPDLNVTASRLATAGRDHDGFSELAPDQAVLGFLRGDGVIQPYADRLTMRAGGESRGRDGDPRSGRPDEEVAISRVPTALDLSVAGELTRAAAGEPGSTASRFLSANSLDSLAEPERRCGVAYLTQRIGKRDRLVADGPPEDDAVTADILALDIQVFDAEAVIFIGLGEDGQPGSMGVDDDGNGIVDHTPGRPAEKDRGEFGAVGSDDPIVTPSDPSYFALVRSDAARSAAIARGAFVDYGYATQPGGNVRLGIVDPHWGNVRADFFPFLSSRWSGVSVRGSTAQPNLQPRKDAGQTVCPRCVLFDGNSRPGERSSLKVTLRSRSPATGRITQFEAIAETGGKLR